MLKKNNGYCAFTLYIIILDKLKQMSNCGLHYRIIYLLLYITESPSSIET